MIDFEEYIENNLDEKVIRKAMIRNRKKIFKWIDTRPGYRIQYDKNGNHKSVRIKAKERLARHLGQSLHGKKKRKNQEKKIERNRIRALQLRKSIGMGHYDKKNPAKRSDSLFSTIKKKAKAAAEKTLHPKYESFIDFLNNENILNESPHSFLLDNDTMEVCWDFYEEDSPTTWMEQLVTLYRDKHIESARPNGNATLDGDIIESIDFEDDELEEVTNNLMYGFEFIAVAHEDFKRCSPKLQADLKKYLPPKLYNRILIGNKAINF